MNHSDMNGYFYPQKAENTASEFLVSEEDRRVLELAELPDVFDFDRAFSILFSWCQRTFARVDRLGGMSHEQI